MTAREWKSDTPRYSTGMDRAGTGTMVVEFLRRLQRFAPETMGERRRTQTIAEYLEDAFKPHPLAELKILFKYTTRSRPEWFISVP